MDKHTEAYVKRCEGCMLEATPNAPEQMKRKELPSQPWQHLAIDYMGPLPTGYSLLVVVDYYSRYIEVGVMKKIVSTNDFRYVRNTHFNHC